MNLTVINITAVSENTSSVLVSWRPPANLSHDHIDKYIMEWHTIGRSFIDMRSTHAHRGNSTVNGVSTFELINHLLPSQENDIRTYSIKTNNSTRTTQRANKKFIIFMTRQYHSIFETVMSLAKTLET